MIGNLPSETDKDQELHVLNLALGEALIGLLQDASRNSNNDNYNGNASNIYSDKTTNNNKSSSNNNSNINNE